MDSVAKRVRRDARRRTEPGSDYTDAMRAYMQWCRTKTCADEAGSLAFRIQGDLTQAEILEALLLSDCPPGDIVEAFGVPAKACDWYRELFFDTTKFRTKLDKISYVENYPDPFGKALKVRALNLGYEYVLYTYANIVPKTEGQRRLVRTMFLSAAYKAMAMNYSGLGTSLNKHAVEHAKLMLKAYEALERFSGDDAGDADNLVRILAAEGETLPANHAGNAEPLQEDIV